MLTPVDFQVLFVLCVWDCEVISNSIERGLWATGKACTRDDPFYVPSYMLLDAQTIKEALTSAPKITLLAFIKTLLKKKETKKQKTYIQKRAEINYPFRSLLDKILCSIWPLVWDTEIPDCKNVVNQLKLLVKLQTGDLSLQQIGLIKPY